MHQQMTTAQPHFTHPVLQANTQNQRLWLRSISRQSLELVLDPENSRQWYSAYLQVLARKGCNLPKQPKTGKAEGQQEGEGVTWQRYLPPPGSTSPTPTLAGEPGKRAWLCLPCGVHTAQARGSEPPQSAPMPGEGAPETAGWRSSGLQTQHRRSQNMGGTRTCAPGLIQRRDPIPTDHAPTAVRIRGERRSELRGSTQNKGAGAVEMVSQPRS